MKHHTMPRRVECNVQQTLGHSDSGREGQAAGSPQVLTCDLEFLVLWVAQQEPGFPTATYRFPVAVESRPLSVTAPSRWPQESGWRCLAAGVTRGRTSFVSRTRWTLTEIAHKCVSETIEIAHHRGPLWGRCRHAVAGEADPAFLGTL